ncbi:hypothetical protein CRG98_039489 [Punica granatum]|uniref:Reverse transcriptase domain-containing protein n=1 Tax=Punica granatum TaxID=22663 RepID=A0A2I0I802_PUNGR|nr:hypothetical protein CRG98_039489 [Punica granatum]
MAVLYKKLRNLKRHLRDFNRTQFGNVHSKVAELHTKFVHVQTSLLGSDNVSTETIEKEVDFRVQLLETIDKEEKFLGQKSRMAWLKAEDQNTAFFHISVKERNVRTTIQVLYTTSGEKLERVQEIKAKAVNFYQGLLGSRDERIMGVSAVQLSSILKRKVSHTKSQSLMSPITKEEIKAALFSMGNDKSLGPDGFTMYFYKHAWQIVQKDFIGAMQHYFSPAWRPWDFLSHFSGAYFSGTINGSLAEYFAGQRGLRQGDHLSPYLFVITMDVFSNLLDTIVVEGRNITCAILEATSTFWKVSVKNCETLLETIVKRIKTRSVKYLSYAEVFDRFISAPILSFFPLRPLFFSSSSFPPPPFFPSLLFFPLFFSSSFTDVHLPSPTQSGCPPTATARFPGTFPWPLSPPHGPDFTHSLSRDTPDSEVSGHDRKSLDPTPISPRERTRDTPRSKTPLFPPVNSPDFWRLNSEIPRRKLEKPRQKKQQNFSRSQPIRASRRLSRARHSLGGARHRLLRPPVPSSRHLAAGTTVPSRRNPFLSPSSSSLASSFSRARPIFLVYAGPAQQIRPSPLCPVQPKRSDPFRLASGSARNARPVSPADSAQLQRPAQLARALGPAHPSAAQLPRVWPNPRARPRPPHARPNSPA